MAGTTTAMTASYKKESAQGMHCFTTSLVPTGNTTNTSTSVASMSSVADISRGMPVSGTGIPGSCFVADIPDSTHITLSIAATATNSGVTLTIIGDVFKMALVKVSPTGTYGSATTNYSNLTGNSDEVSGTGYTAGGFAWTAAQNTTPATSGAGAYWSWSTNPSWTSATISTTGGIIYNSTTRGGTTGRAVSVHDFGGTQTVTGGTLTILLPTNALGTAILQIS